MATQISPFAGKPASSLPLINVARLLADYFTQVPDPGVLSERVAFGTSGHRGSSTNRSFNESHVLAITQAICDLRKANGIDGPLFMGMDTHALSGPACASALEVLAGNGIDVMLASGDEFTPTPAISHAILCHNGGRRTGLADGIILTPSHNPPGDGGLKYNPPNGGPAGEDVTRSIERAANAYLDADLAGVKRIPHAQALHAATTHSCDLLHPYVDDLGSAINFDIIRHSNIRVAVDPMGGAGVHYWSAIAERYGINLVVLSEVVDPTFSFMSLDWDGQIRMDPSSQFAMQNLQIQKSQFDICFACDTDHDRHGIVTPRAGLLPSNTYLSVMIDYLFTHRPCWLASAAIGKTVVSTQLIDRLAIRLLRGVYEVPVGFKWFAPGLLAGSLGFAGEESAGAAFLRRDGRVWTSDKDGMIAALLAAEMTAQTGTDPQAQYETLASEFGNPVSETVQAAATPEGKAILSALSPQQFAVAELAGEAVETVIDMAPGNGARIGGVKVSTANGWFAARPSGTENIYKIYGESFKGEQHLQLILQQAQSLVNSALSAKS